jgi:DNA-binding NtrC family response regulator
VVLSFTSIEISPVKKDNLNGKLRGVVNELVGRGLTLSQARGEFERQFLLASIQHHDGNMSKSARALGVHRNTLRNKVCDLGIGNDDYSRRRTARRKSLES